MTRKSQAMQELGSSFSGRGIGPSVNLGPDSSRADVDAMQQGMLLFRLTGERDFLAADKFYVTNLTTLNGSGVTGEVIIGLDVDTGRITVAISAAGLVPDQVHIQHIHGFLDGTDAKVPTLAQDSDGDGFVELGEGLATYGPILLNLSTNHDNGSGGDNGHSHGGLSGFPTAPDGTIWFVESYDATAGMLGEDPMLDLREIVIHGMNVPDGAGAGTLGEVDGTGGYKLVLPAASGELVEIGSAKELRQFVKSTDFDMDARDAIGVTGQGHASMDMGL